MHRIFLLSALMAILLALTTLTPANAQEPTPTPSFENPYDFQPLDLDNGQDNPTIIDLGEKIRDVSFINELGSIAVTVWVILDDFAGGGVLGYYVIILLAVGCIVWVARFVYSKPIKAEPLETTPIVNISYTLGGPEAAKVTKNVFGFIKAVKRERKKRVKFY